jgi:hypothetical protein
MGASSSKSSAIEAKGETTPSCSSAAGMPAALEANGGPGVITALCSDTTEDEEEEDEEAGALGAGWISERSVFKLCLPHCAGVSCGLSFFSRAIIAGLPLKMTLCVTPSKALKMTFSAGIMIRGLRIFRTVVAVFERFRPTSFTIIEPEGVLQTVTPHSICIIFLQVVFGSFCVGLVLSTQVIKRRLNYTIMSELLFEKVCPRLLGSRTTTPLLRLHHEQKSANRFLKNINGQNNVSVRAFFQHRMAEQQQRWGSRNKKPRDHYLQTELHGKVLESTTDDVRGLSQPNAERGKDNQDETHACRVWTDYLKPHGFYYKNGKGLETFNFWCKGAMPPPLEIHARAHTHKTHSD